MKLKIIINGVLYETLDDIFTPECLCHLLDDTSYELPVDILHLICEMTLFKHIKIQSGYVSAIILYDGSVITFVDNFERVTTITSKIHQKLQDSEIILFESDICTAIGLKS